jgi:hypothetical protein
MVEAVACYGYEVWTTKRRKKSQLLAMEMGYVRSAKFFRMTI